VFDERHLLCEAAFKCLYVKDNKIAKAFNLVAEVGFKPTTFRMYECSPLLTPLAYSERWSSRERGKAESPSGSAVV